ncbi:maleylpyruvate isomerase family mycothiol-dependent enzyme [Streptacidiphilus fuscans]|uniref:Maleylpyruvate isomerase family mycothiol-dependent enzyme n=1 Tax=Streptacidiphilus fuscans TaxID=2789292 RepID=A0A931F9Q1_9ACTN|nr:maleylpyruvate isomerase family mycothiol-dependent enzyme [Streptacidiphilus fuscans]MBF9066857.1 maleylpyruvate isomerase family mycothiol-dependent enzyme [Streptacidiphilus fuscans]
MAGQLLDVRGRQELHDAVLAAAEDIAALLRSGGEGTVPIPDAEWTVAEAAAHLVLANALMAEIAAGVDLPLYGDGTPGGIAAANAASLDAFPERDLAVLADGVVDQARAYVEAAGQRAGTEPVVTPMGPMVLDILGSYLLTHMLGHGWDMARALRRPHMVDRRRVELCLPFLFAAMPRVVVPDAVGDLNATFTLGLRGSRERWSARFTSGSLKVTPKAVAPDGPSDCTIISEPVTFFLIALGRCSPWGAIARGRVLAWGRRPRLAAAFATYFRAP